MTKEQIKKSIEYIIDGAWENPSEAMYRLEQLPKDNSDCDEIIGDYVTKLYYQIKKGNREFYEYDVEDLVNHYYANQDEYEEFN